MAHRAVDGFGGVTCIVTGGLGFIGSNLVHHLVRLGASVRVVDALVAAHGGDRRNIDGLHGVEVLVAPIDAPEVAQVLDGAELVFNLAGQVSHTSSMRDPLTDLHFNLITHASFLETLRAVNPDCRVVHASTRQVYGIALRQPVDELHPARPVDVNGVAKLAGERLHLVHAHAYGTRVTSLRLSNVYGPRQRLTSDELGFLPVFVRRALRGETLHVFGDGSQRRDCLYVDDVVRALLAATADRCVGEVYNVGHHTDHSLAEIAKTVCRVAGSTAGLEYVPWPEDRARIDIGSFHTDGTRIRTATGWEANVELEEGLERTIAFYRSNPWYLSST